MRVDEVTGRVLLDTNVLISATLAGDSRHGLTREVLALGHREDVELYVSVQNLAEMFPNLTGPKNPTARQPRGGTRKIRSIARLCGLTVLSLVLETIHQALDLCVADGVTR